MVVTVPYEELPGLVLKVAMQTGLCGLPLIPALSRCSKQTSSQNLSSRSPIDLFMPLCISWMFIDVMDVIDYFHSPKGHQEETELPAVCLCVFINKTKIKK